MVLSMMKYSNHEGVQDMYVRRVNEITEAFGDIDDMRKLNKKICDVLRDLQISVDAERFRLEEKVDVANKDMVRLANSDADIDYLSEFIGVKSGAVYNLEMLKDYHQQVLTCFFKAQEADAAIVVVEINLKLAKTPEQVEDNVARGYEARRDRVDRLHHLHETILNLKRFLKLIPDTRHSFAQLS
jgi:hypothetical protein